MTGNEVQTGWDSLWFKPRGSGADTVTTPHGYKPGASGMTPVCRPTPIVRFMPMSELALKATHALHGTLCSHGRVFTSGPSPENPYTLQLATCKRTLSQFFLSRTKVEMKGLPIGSAAFIPRRERRGLSPRFGKASPGVGNMVQTRAKAACCKDCEQR
jgi:hypothetical protein